MDDLLIDPSIAHVRFRGDVQAARRWLGQAQQELVKLHARIRTGLASHGHARRTMADGTIVDVRVTGSQNVIEIEAGSGLTRTEAVVHLVPDFLSGVVADAETFFPTEYVAAAYDAYDEGQAAPASPRFDVPVFEDFQRPEDDTQYAHLKATRYSGKMRRLVQVLLGFGRAGERDEQTGALRLETRHAERKREHFDLPREQGQFDAFRRRHRRIADTFEDYERDAIENGRQVRFDYRSINTDGLTTAADGRCWIVKIHRTLGVLAMPLPLRDDTTTAAFRDRLAEGRTLESGESSPDYEALQVVDEFGGYPSGLSIPRFRFEIDQYLKAGLAIQVIETDDPVYADFQSFSDWTAEMGWAFSESGDAAHQTAWRFRPDGFQEVGHFALSISIGVSPADSDRTPGADALYARVEAAVDTSDIFLYAIRHKLRRMPESEIVSLTAQWDAGGVQAAFDRIRAYEVDAGVDIEAEMAREEIGPFYSDPTLGDLSETASVYNAFLAVPISTDEMRYGEASLSNRAGTARDDAPVCDTTVFVYFEGDTLHRVRFWRDTGNRYQSVLSEGFYSDRVDLRRQKPDDGVFHAWYSCLHLIDGNRSGYLIADCKASPMADDPDSREIYSTVVHVSDYDGGSVVDLFRDEYFTGISAPVFNVWPAALDWARFSETYSVIGDQQSRVRYTELEYEDSSGFSAGAPPRSQDGAPTIDGDLDVTDLHPRTSAYVGVLDAMPAGGDL